MSLATNLTSAFTRVATEAKALRTLINGNAADLSALTTTAKTSLVAAINELKASSGSPAPASTTVAGVVQLATDTEAIAGAVTGKATTPANVKAVIGQLVGAAPTTLDTLAELDAAINNDPNFATTITTALAGKQPLDADLTAIAALVSAVDKLPYSTGTGTWALTTFTAAGRALVDDADTTAQRATLSVYSQAEIGDPTTDFVAVFTTGLV
jgi:hypothetical protein